MYTHNKYPRCYNSVALHELTPMSASQQPTQKPYENHFLFQKEGGWLCNFCGEADNVGQTSCACFVHATSTIFCTYNQILMIFNIVKKVFK